MFFLDQNPNALLSSLSFGFFANLANRETIPNFQNIWRSLLEYADKIERRTGKFLTKFKNEVTNILERAQTSRRADFMCCILNAYNIPLNVSVNYYSINDIFSF